ncbi:MFS transporter [Streptomyces sp. NPDC093085]|uniref:MFS transporter n=1 Tax=Streptomyces sp. NPDC093085 TaxID=3155068 RepID=UPI00341768F7
MSTEPAMSTNPLEDAPLSTFHKKLTLYASGGPFLDGYVLSIIGVALAQITTQWGLSSSTQGLIGASTLVGILLGAFAGGYLTDRFGRQALFTIDLIVIIAASLAQFFVQDAFWLIALRLVIGVAVGADYPIATSLLTEFTPRKYRGPLLGAFVVMWFVGAAAAYLVGEVLRQVGPDGWRWMLASATVPALAIVLARFGTPESPLWLASKGRRDEANKALELSFGPGVTVDDLEPEPAENLDPRALLRSGYGKRMLFISLFWSCSVIPLFAVYAFAPAILTALKLGGDLVHYGSALITVMFLVGCVIAVLLVNRIGRRPLLIHSFAWSGAALLLLGVFPDSTAAVIMILFVAYAIFTGGSQILQWVYPNELFPTEIRGSAVGLASSLSRIGAAIGTYLVPISLSALGVGATMLIAAAVSVVGMGISIAWAPETRGMTLAESASLDSRPLEPVS